MSEDIMLWKEWEGRIVPRGFSAGYVVLSYLVSYVGAWTTLELLNKRTAGRGMYNWYLLFGSSISMGGIAIWCMHYISNRAIILGDGQLAMQIAYSSGFTALSFFVPILVLLAAFTAVGSDDRVSFNRVAMGGTLAGLAICGMHYLGQAGISNYSSVYNIGNVVGSAIVAIVASIVALSVFFVLRATWTNFWWKRALCGILLAGAVFGMHWLASIGTQYRLKNADPSGPHNTSPKSLTIIVIVLSIVASFILIAIAVLAHTRRTRSANRAQQVVLACAIFDDLGKLMVTPEGLLPNQKVTTSYVEQSLEQVFGISHPVFHWIFRTTRNWSSVSSLLPGMRNHVYHNSTLKASRARPKSEPHLSNDKGGPIEEYSIIFRELFCIAAADLAEQLNEPLENVGILFDEIFSTGRKVSLKSIPVDLESDSMAASMLGKGQLLFLVRRANGKEAERLSASGYRFAEIKNVAHIIARNMQINCHDLQDRLSSMYEYSSETNSLEPGVHLACFAIRNTVRGGFEVLVRRDARNQLPTMQLPIDDLNSWKIDYLSRLNGSSVSNCLKILKAKSASTADMKKEQIFATQLYHALEELNEEIDDPFFSDARLIGIPVSTPCCGLDGGGKPGQATLIAFRIIMPDHFHIQGQKLEFTPLDFFKTQQYVQKYSSDHEFFARMIHREFGPILNRRMSSVGDNKNPMRATFLRRCLRNFSSKSTPDVKGPLDVSLPTLLPKAHTKTPRLRFWDRKSDGEPQNSLKISLNSTPETQLLEMRTFGGIMVSQEVSVDVRDGDVSLGKTSDDGFDGIDMLKIQDRPMGTRSWAMKEVDNPETYVDRLFAACLNMR